MCSIAVCRLQYDPASLAFLAVGSSITKLLDGTAQNEPPQCSIAARLPSSMNQPEPVLSRGAIALLSLAAGFVDAACFIGLFGVFTAHVTGNMAMIASGLVRPDKGMDLRAEVIVAFICGVLSARLVLPHGESRVDQRRFLCRVLLVEALWLGLLLIMLATLGPPTLAPSASAYAVTFCAGGAMGAQSGLSRLSESIGMATSVMSSNLTQWVIDLVSLFGRLRRSASEARAPVRFRFALLSRLLAAFSLGAAIGATAEAHFGLRVIALPLLIIAAVGAQLVWRGADAPGTTRQHPQQ